MKKMILNLLTGLTALLTVYSLQTNAQTNWFEYKEKQEMPWEGSMALLYRIPVDSVYKVVYEYKPISTTAAWMQQPAYAVPAAKVDSLLATDIVPAYYVVAKAVQDRIYLHIREKKGFTTSIADLRDLQLLEVRSNDGKPMSDATVVQRKKKIPYDPEMRGYMLKPVKNELIEIRRGEYALYYNGAKSRREREYNSYNPWNESKPRNTTYNGYLVTNQPIYRPGDTVKYKAYLLHPEENGAVRERVKVELQEVYGKRYQIHELKAEGEGVYFSEFVLGDSIKTDRRYQLIITGKGSNNTIMQYLKVEDYQLEETRIRVTRDNVPVYQPRDSVMLFAYAYNTNGLPVLDGTIYTTVTLPYYQGISQKPVFVPDTIFRKSTPVSPDGQTYVGFSTDVLPAIVGAQLRCDITLVNSNFERKDTSFFIQYTATGKYLQIKETGNKIIAMAMLNKKSVPANGNMTINGKKKAISYPYEVLMDETTRQYLFEITNDTGGITSFQYYEPGNDSLEVYDDYRGDTAYFTILNPKKINLRYALYDGDKLTGSGAILKDTLLSIHSRRNRTVTMIAQFRQKDQAVHRTYVAPKYHKRMLIEMKKKDIVFPGQQDSISIALKDVNGKGIARTNVTVFAYTAKFKEEFIPAMQYAGYLAPGLDDDPIFDRSITLKSYNNSRSSIPITPQNASIAGADTVFFYKHIYFNPTHTAWYLYGIPDSKLSQMAIYLCKNGTYTSPDAIYIDGNPVYLRMLRLTNNPHALLTTEGEHQVTIRTHNARYTITSVVACKGMKTNLFINLDSLLSKNYSYSNYRFIYKDTMSDSLTPGERDIWARRMLMYRSEYGQNFRIVQGINTYDAFTNGNVYNGYGSTRGLPYTAIGPLNMNDSIGFFEPLNIKTRFMPELHFIYTIRPGMMRLEKQSTYDILNMRLQNNTFIPQMNFTAPAWTPFDSLLVNLPVRNTQPQNKLQTSLSIQGDPVPKSTDLARLQMHFTASRPNYLVFHSLNNKGVYVFSNNTYSGNQYNVPSGDYEVIAIWNDTLQSKISKLQLRSGGITYIAIPDKQEPFDATTAPKWLRKGAAVIYNNAPVDVTFNTYDYTQEQDKGSVAGSVYDDVNEPLIGAKVEVMSGGQTIAGTSTDEEGNFMIRSLQPGSYDVKVNYVGFRQILVTHVIVSYKKTTHFVARMNVAGTALEEITVTSYRVPLIDRYSAGTTTIRTAEEIEKMPVRSTESVAYSTAGVYSNADGLSLSGSRSEGTLYYIDGVQVRGGANALTQGTVDQIQILVGGGFVEPDKTPPTGRKGLKPDAAKKFMADFLNNMQAASGMRQQFRDWAIWEPNLWTNKEGNTSFSVKYPDDMTSWKTYVLAMNEKGFWGKVMRLTRAFKPLAAELSVPRFLRYGDSVELVGKVMNYTGNPFNVKTSFLSQGNMVTTNTANITNARVAQLKLTAPAKNSADTVELVNTYMLQTDNGYTDGEERKIPVYPVGLIENKGDFFLMNRDTIVQSRPSDSAGYFTGKTTIHVDGSMLEVMLREIEQLKVYPHGCTEQLTTKLLAIYYEEEIKRLLGKKDFNNTKEKKEILEKLVRAQNHDGSFGWFYNNNTDIRVTNYVVSTMMKVNKDGWLDFIIRRALTHLSNNLLNMDSQNLIASLSTLSEAGYASDYRSHLHTIKFDKQTLYNQAAIVRIKKQQQLPYRRELDTVMSKANEGINELYWNGHSYDWYRDDLATTLLMYRTIYDDSIYGSKRDAIERYLLFKRTKGSYGNTAESGMVLTTLLPQLLRNNNAKPGKRTEVYLSGSITDTISSFPTTVQLKDKNPVINVRKQGFSPAFVSVNYEYFNMQPKERLATFEVKTTYLKDGLPMQSVLRQGDKIVLRTTVTCKKDAEYVMIDIPIPAGCFHGDEKPSVRWGIESSRERFKDRTVIYCSKMPKGTYTFDVPLQARYKGSFNVNPASASMMYYPEEYGNENMQRVVVK